MALTISQLGDAALELNVFGKLQKEDYEAFVPKAESRIAKQGKLDLLINVSRLEGWTPSALWEDLKWDAKHYSDVTRLAIVSDDSDKEWMATLSKPFTGAEVEHYPATQLDKARRWVRHQD